MNAGKPIIGSAGRMIALAFLATAVLAMISSFVGATSLASIGSLFSGASETDRLIWWQLRLPRVVVGVLVGGSLAAAGVGFQGLFRNPLAEPYVIGASSGAALGVALVVVMGLRTSVMSVMSVGATAIMALAGSVAVVMLVLMIGGMARTPSTTSLLLAGVVISSLLSAIVSALMFLFDEKAVVILSWLMGSLAGSHWGTAGMIAIVGGIGIVAIAALSRPLDAFALGDTTSQSLGLDVNRFRWLIILAASIATAGAVASSGVIGFVGLISPHIARFFVGSRNVVLIPMSVCVGGMLMLIADMIARTIIAPAELPVGIVTAILGCPFFLFLMLRSDATGALTS